MENIGCRQVCLIIVLATSTCLFSSIQKLSLGYILHEPHFWCSSVHLNRSVGGRPPKDVIPADQCRNDKHINRSTVPCEQWDYDRSEYPETAVSQFNLVCGDRYWIFLSQSIYILGYVVGTFVSGILSDKYGRKPIILISAVLCHLFSTAAAFSSTIMIFNIWRFLIGASAVAQYVVSFTYCMEIAGVKWKSFVSSLFGVSISVGLALVPAISWVFPSWSDIQLFATLPTILFMMPLWVSSFFKESPKWLVSRGLYRDADETNTQGVTRNSVSGSEISMLIHTDSSSSGSLLDLVRTPGIRFSTLVLSYVWCVFLIIFLFVLMNCKDIIPGNSTLNIEILSGMDLIAGLITFPIVVYINRRLSTSLCFFLTGTSFLLHFFHPNPVYKQVFAQIGLFCNTMCFNLMSVFTVEIYPTVIRSMAMGSLNAIGRIAAMLPPLLLLVLLRGEEFLILGLMAVLAAGLVWLLPETKDMEMVDSLEEGEMFNRKYGGLKFFI